MRHVYSHMFFFVELICTYFLFNKITKSRKALLGVRMVLIELLT